MNNIKYYNDNLAYDFDLFMPKNKQESDDKVISARPRKKQKARRSARGISVGVTSAAVVMLVAATLLAGLFMRAKITEVTRDISKVKTEITELESEKTRLYVALENKISYKNIEEAATSLGMKKIDRNQVVYIRLNDKNKAANSKGELYAQNK